MKQTQTPIRRVSMLLAVAAALGAHGAASAQVLAPEQAAAEASPNPSQWGLGIGAGFSRAPYRDFDDDVQALPLILFENRWISAFGTRLDVKLPSAGPVQFRLRAQYSGDGYEAKDSPYLEGMAERKGGVWVGGAAIWRGSYATLGAEALASTGSAEGKRVKLELSREFHTGPVTVTPRIAANWYDSKYVDYYYGVRADEARAGRAQFTGDAGSSVQVGVRFGYAYNKRHNFFVDVSANSLSSDIKDSPLIDRSTESSVRLGYLYAF